MAPVLHTSWPFVYISEIVPPSTHSAESTAAQQRALWGRRPRDWAETAEPANAALFTAVLDALDVGPGDRVLDVGCGSGLAARLAADRGAVVAGADATPELLEIARERTPGGDFRTAPLELLPWADGSFDVALGINAFPFAADPAAALREAGRCVGPGGSVAATSFAEPERNDGTAMHLAMRSVQPPETTSTHAPYALAAPGGLEELARAAGLDPVSTVEVPVTWAYPDVDTAVRAALASAGGALAIDVAGEPAVREALEAAAAAFTDAGGAVALHNVFRVLVATTPGGPAR